MADDKSVVYAILGIVAIMAIVGLIMMFSAAKQTATGNYAFSARANYAPQGNPALAGSFRTGEQAQPAQFANDAAALSGNSLDAQTPSISRNY